MGITQRVLVVDDDPDIRELLSLVLQAQGYEVRSVEHGQAALDVLATWEPVVIILDLRMPVMDGWEFRARQLAEPGWAAIPVVVLTGDVTADRRAPELRAAAIFRKPMNVNAFLDVIGRVVDGAGLPRTGEGQ